MSDAEPAGVRERRTGRWAGAGVLALLALGLGVLVRQPGLVLASAVGVAATAYAHVTAAPPVAVDLERDLSTHTPEPGETVTVRLTVHNESDRRIPDLRIRDGVPDELTVETGTPGHATALSAGGSARFEYTVLATRGEHAFDPATVVTRDASGATERAASVAEPTSLACEPDLPTESVAFPLRPATTRSTGRYPGEEGGPGVEFHATRSYRPGDPLSRIDWNRTAKTGEFTTVDYRVERTVRVAALVDARAAAYRAPAPDAATAVERSIEALASVYVSLTEEGHEVGVGALGPTDCWLEPGTGDHHRDRVRRLLGTHPALAPVPTEEHTDTYATIQRFKGRLPPDAQVVLFTPLTDDIVVDSVVRLDASGYPVTVVSPDPTASDTAGHRLARIRRRLRIADLRSRGVPVLEVGHEESLAQALAGAGGRWSR